MQRDAQWSLEGIGKLDHFGAQLLWNTWGRVRPKRLLLGTRQEEFFDRLYHLGEVKEVVAVKRPWRRLENFGVRRARGHLTHS